MSITVGSSTITVNSGAVMGAPAGTTPLFFARAWVNFNGSGTPAISGGSGTGSGNVSTITDNGVGDYTLNFGTNMTDTNYCAVATRASAATRTEIMKLSTLAAASVRVLSHVSSLGGYEVEEDASVICVVVFR